MLRTAPLEIVLPDPLWGSPDDPLEIQIWQLVNAHRTSMGLSILGLLDSLVRSAEWKSLHMGFYSYLAHDDPAPPISRSWYARLQDNGYPGGQCGENIAYGYPSAQAVFDGWMASDGHRENIENPAYTTTGLGAAHGKNGWIYWSQDFGAGAPSPGPGPGPAPSLLSRWVESELPTLERSPEYRKWIAANPVESQKLSAFISGGARPKPRTKLGQFFVGTVALLGSSGSLGSWVSSELPLLQSAAQYKSWRTKNPADAARFDGLLANGPLPVMSSAFGQFLVATIGLIANG